MERSIVMVVVACVSAPSAFAETTTGTPGDDRDTRRLILRLENEGREATLTNDVAANDRLLADDWVNLNPAASAGVLRLSGRRRGQPDESD